MMVILFVCLSIAWNASLWVGAYHVDPLTLVYFVVDNIYCIILLFMSCALESQEFINYLVSFLSIDCWYSDGLQSPRHQAFFMLIAHCLFLKLFFSFSFINFQLWLRVIGHKLDTVLVLVKHPWASCWLAVQAIQLDDPLLVQPKQECTESRPDKFLKNWRNQPCIILAYYFIHCAPNKCYRL